MNPKLTIEEIEAKAKEIWLDADSIKVEEPTKGIIHITLSAMYEAPGRSLKQLILLSEFFGTTEIEEADNFSLPGCESCDYGSRYGVTLEIKLPLEKPAATADQANAA